MHVTQTKFTLPGALVLVVLLAASVLLPTQANARNQSEKAVALALKGRFQQAFDAARDPVARKTVEWLYLRKRPKAAGYSRLMNFVQRNKNWPSTQGMEKSAEGHLLGAGANTTVLHAHFSRHSPKSGEGTIALARLKLASGDKSGVKKLIRSAWLDISLSKTGESIILRKYRSFLNKEDLQARWTRFIYRRKMRGAVRNANYISRDHARATQSAALLFKRRKAALGSFRKLSARMRNTYAMKFALAHYYRWKHKPGLSMKVMAQVNPKAANIGAGDAWWALRKRVARELLGPLNRKQWQSAYKVAANHGFSSGKYFAQGEFLAGWIAFRFLNDPQRGYRHFVRISAADKSADERSRGFYWLGRTQLATGRPSDAKKSFRAAAAYPTKFYGQLSRDALGLGNRPLPLNVVTPTKKDRAAVSRDEVLRAFTLISRAGGRRYQREFLWALSRRFRKHGHHAAVSAHIHTHSGYVNAMRYARIARLRGYAIDNWAFPKGAMPRWKQIGYPVERALVFGLTRQESEFQPRAGSHAGAQGLMQLMPGTAKMVARKFKQRHRRARLTREPAYNVMLGAALLGDLMKDYDGSIPMTLAAYNAGPGNVRKWVARYGDPRTPEIDPLDWTESIHFEETRRYVRKVMQNMQVYRNRFGQRRLHGLMADLHGAGGRTGSVPKTRSACNGSGSLSIANLIARC